LDTSDKSFADAVVALMGDDLIFQDSIFYVWYKQNWHKNKVPLVKNIIQRNILKLVDAWSCHLYSTGVIPNDNVDLPKAITKAKGAIKTDSKLNSVVSQLTTTLAGRMDNVKFDVHKPDVFCFNNVAFNLTTGEKYEVKKEDYITMKTGYDYVAPSDQEVAVVKQIFDSIFPDPEMKKTYISIMRSGLSGRRQEHLFMANGCGRNGKGLVNELMMDVTGNYGHKMAIGVLTDKIKTGANPEVNELHLKRWVVTNEPNDNETIKGGNIKRLTGDNIIEARGLYQSNGQTILNLTLVLEVNKMINICGRIDEAIVNRFVNVRFPAYFTDNPEN
jgi:putative DNA primase/helicase